jgi:hypothetical protein
MSGKMGSSPAVMSTLMNSPHFAPWRPLAWAFGPRHAEVAQLVEHATEKSRCGSIPPLGTTKFGPAVAKAFRCHTAS